MKSYHELKGIFTIDKVSSEAQDEIDRINEQLTAARGRKTAAETSMGETETKPVDPDEKSMRNQYTALKSLRDNYGKLIPSKFGKSKTLIPKIRRHISKTTKMADDEIKRQYDAIYGSDTKEYQEFITIADTSVLDNVGGEAYRNCANTLFLVISKLPKEIYPGVDEKAFREKLAALKDAISGNVELIKAKIAEPSKIVTLVDIEPTLDYVKETIENINKMIRTNNEAFNAKTKIIADLRERLFCNMAYVLRRDFKNHDDSRKIISDGIETQKKIISNRTTLISQLKEQLRGKHGGVKDTSAAMKNINNMLRDANFQRFELRPHNAPSLPAGKK